MRKKCENGDVRAERETAREKERQREREKERAWKYITDKITNERKDVGFPYVQSPLASSPFLDKNKKPRRGGERACDFEIKRAVAPCQKPLRDGSIIQWVTSA